MFIEQNIHEYLDNPMGKGSSVIMNRNSIKENLDMRYDLLIDKFGDFEHKVYIEDDTYFIHILVPSESRRRNTYDVVIQFSNSEIPGEDFSNELTLKNYYVRFFSNCPSFVYTYAYVYREYDRDIKFLNNKYRAESLDTQPSTRNPGEIISFEKSTYFACKYIVRHRELLNKSKLVDLAARERKGFPQLIEDVRTSDKIMTEISKENNRLKSEGGNKGYVRVKRKVVKGDSVYDVGTIKTAGVDKTSPTKESIKRKRKESSSKAKVSGKSKVTNTVGKSKRPSKPKVKPVTSSMKKKT